MVCNIEIFEHPKLVIVKTNRLGSFEEERSVFVELQRPVVAITIGVWSSFSHSLCDKISCANTPFTAGAVCPQGVAAVARFATLVAVRV